MAECLRMVDWEEEFYTIGAQMQYSKLVSILDSLIRRFVPTSADKPDRIPWSVNPPRALTREKNRLWSVYKATRVNLGRGHQSAVSAWDAYVYINSKIKKFAIDSQISYERKISDQIGSNPKLFHSYLKHRKVGKPSIGPIKLQDGTLTDDPQLMADCFASSFASVFIADTPDDPVQNQFCESVTDDICITSSQVHEMLLDLDGNSSMGVDGVHPRLLKNLASDLCVPLSIIFNSSLEEGVLPVEWLNALIVPIYKKSVRNDPLNYRPISLTSVPCKVLEKIIVQHLLEFLESNSLLSPHQFGFRSGHSTNDQLIVTYNDITGFIDSRLVVDLVFFDYSKAFDTVRHVVLIQKLFDIGVCQQILSWIECFLRERSMQVKVSGSISESRSVKSGVPQGSVLGPLLFLIYVNHTISNLECHYKIFADDTKLYLSYSSQEFSTGETAVQRDIDALVHTSKSWGLEMNVSKCVCLRFCSRALDAQHVGDSPYTVGSKSIRFASSHSDLGVTIDRSLKFHDHIRRSANVCNALTTNIFSCTLNREAEFLINIYKSHIRPKLEYCSPLWNVGYMGDLRVLERVQRRWTRAVLGLEDLSYGDRLSRLNLFSFQGRLLRADLILVWKIFNNKCAISPEQVFVMDTSFTRGHNFKLYLPRTNLEVRKRFFSVRVIHSWNSLANDTVCSTSLNVFKCLLQRDLGQTF